MENSTNAEMPQHNSEKTNKKPEEKKSNAAGWITLLVSVWFVVNGFMRVSEGNTGWGLVLIVVGAGGFIYKLYELTKSSN